MGEQKNSVRDLLCKLSKKYAFIYQINNSFYYIGAGIFRECSSEEIDLYNKLKNEYNKQKEILDHVKALIDNKACAAKKINEYYKQILDYANSDDTKNCNLKSGCFNDKVLNECKKNLEKLLTGLNDEQLEDLAQQMDFMIKIYTYSECYDIYMED